MIVKCEQCQTRFKIPDEKVTERGVKVRCTKCQFTFRVSRAPDAAPSARPPDAAEASSATLAGFDPFAALDSPGAAPAASPPAPPSARFDPFAFGQNGAAHPSPARSAAPPARPAPPPPLADDVQQDLSDLFSAPTRQMEDFSAPTRNQAGAPIPPAARPPPASAAAPPARRPPSPSGPAAAGADPLDATVRAGALPPAGVASAGRPGSNRLAGGGANPFDVTVQAGPLPAGTAPSRKPPPPPPAFDPAGAGAFELDGPGASTGDSPPASNLLGDLPPPDDQPVGDTGAASDADDASSTLVGASSAETDPGADPFSPDGATGGESASDGVDHGMFDMPARPHPPAASGPEAALPAAVPIGRLKASAQQAPAASPGSSVAPEALPPPSAARRVSGLIVNLAVAAGLVLVLATVGSVYLNEGKLDASALSMERMKALFAPGRPRVAVDVSNGLYETQLGRPIFYVRGEVENRGSRVAKVKVRAEILDGAQLVRAAEGFAGAVPSPEELYSVSSAQDVETLTARLDQGAEELASGARKPFLLLFYEYPSELAGLRLKVTALDEPAPTAAR